MELKMLIITESTTKGAFYKELFTELGHKPIVVTNAAIAAKLFITFFKYGQPFDLVFTDYLLDGTDGITLAGEFIKIYPMVNLVLFPSDIFFETDVKNNYYDFGYFCQEIPDASFPVYRKIINQTSRKKRKLLERMMNFHYQAY